MSYSLYFFLFVCQSVCMYLYVCSPPTTCTRSRTAVGNCPGICVCLCFSNPPHQGRKWKNLPVLSSLPQYLCLFVFLKPILSGTLVEELPNTLPHYLCLFVFLKPTTSGTLVEELPNTLPQYLCLFVFLKPILSGTLVEELPNTLPQYLCLFVFLKPTTSGT